jgi:hypothetical protein
LKRHSFIQKAKEKLEEDGGAKVFWNK